MNSFGEAWAYICDYCRERIAEVAYQTWINRTTPVDINFDEGIAVLEVPNEFHKKTLEKCYFSLIKDAFYQIFGSEINIKLVLPKENIKKKELTEEDSKTDNDFEYTFDNFIVGSSNQLAYAAAIAVAENPGIKYNPFLIYGNSGLGKTHLLNAIKNRIKEKNPDVNINRLHMLPFLSCRGGKLQSVKTLYTLKNSTFRITGRESIINWNLFGEEEDKFNMVIYW
jgi:chromosomal replication initiator protein